MRGTVIRRWAGAVAGLAVATTVAGARAGAQAAGAPDTRPTIAVLYFNATAMVKRDEYAPLNKGIAELLITELAANPRIRVVEREQLQQILDEQNLGAGDRVDKETAVRLGKILGARYMITGGFVVDPKETMRLDARVFNVETTEIRRQDVWTVTGKAENMFALVSEMGEKLRAGLNLPALEIAPAERPRDEQGGAGTPRDAGAAKEAQPKERVRKETAAAPPSARDSSWTPSRAARTSNTKPADQKRAAILFSRAIQAKDRGDLAAARRYYDEAVEAYPDFGRAKVLNASLERRPAGN